MISQPQCWRRASELAPNGLLPVGARVALVGCGTSRYVAEAVAAWREQAGLGISDAFAASEMPIGRRYDLIVVISRSGTTTEVLRLVAALPRSTEVLAVTGSVRTPVAEAASRSIALPFADEEAVVQTRFATSVLALFRAQFGHDVGRLARLAEAALEAPLPARLDRHRQFVFLGRGAGVGLASEAALKFREAALAWTEAYPAMELRHGPISLLDDASLVWSLDELPAGLAEEIASSEAALEAPVGESDPMVELVRIHRGAIELALSKGLDPSRPRRLSRSIVLASTRRERGGAEDGRSVIDSVPPAGLPTRQPSVLALDIGGTKLAAAVVDREGGLSHRQVVETRAEEGAHMVLDRAVQLAERVLRTEPERTRPKALGVATKGLTREEGVLLSGMIGWGDLRIPAVLRARFAPMTAWTMNDVKAATLAELTWGALRGVSDGLYVNLGTGVAAGLVVGGRLFEGAHGAAGEIAYLVPDRSLMGRPRRAGEPTAPLEALLGGGAVPERARERLGRALTMEQLVRARKEDDGAARLIEEILSDLAFWIVNVSLVLDPSRLVIGGGFLGAGPELCQKISSSLASCGLFLPEVVEAHFGADSALVGAGALAFSRLDHCESAPRQGPTTRP